MLFSESALKATHFIELCNQRRIPLVFLQNITGFMVGKQYERGGIAKDGAKMVHAVANAHRAEVHGDHRRLVRRRQLRHVRPRVLAALPLDVAERAHLGDGRRAGRGRADDREARSARARGQGAVAPRRSASIADPVLAKYEEEGSPYYSTARLWDDGVIDPADTRIYLGLGLSIAYNAPIADAAIRRVQDVGIRRMATTWFLFDLGNTLIKLAYERVLENICRDVDGARATSWWTSSRSPAAYRDMERGAVDVLGVLRVHLRQGRLSRLAARASTSSGATSSTARCRASKSCSSACARSIASRFSRTRTRSTRS